MSGIWTSPLAPPWSGWWAHQLCESQRLVIQVLNSGVEEPAARTADDELPAWSDVYEGLSDSEIDELDAAIVRTHSSRDVA